MRVLCVAEKPSAAKKIAELLSQNNFRTLSTGDTYVKNYCFNYRLNNRDTSICMTSLKGHILTIEFADPQTKAWNMYPMINLFDIALERKTTRGGEAIVDNLRTQARNSDVLFIWTDCDREGEAIGGEVVDICRSVKPGITVWRARFSSMMPDQIHYAAQNHVALDERQVDAVNARAELDLRVGAAFTRLQTLRLKNILNGGEFSKKLISYGSCQFPTLGFVVSRYLLIERFIPEAFWKIQMSYNQSQTPQQIADEEQEIRTSFKWRRNHLFNRWACLIFLEKCIEAKMARVNKVNSKQTQKWKPLPLTTVEMQKVGCRVLGMSGEEIMRIAEELYTGGLISYPRTETDQYDRDFEFMPVVEKLKQNQGYGLFAQLLTDGEFERPRNGKNNDKAHPPIHPTSYQPSLAGNKRRVYEFIARRFLGSCWKNAKGYETTVEVEMGGELFDAKGLVVLERNYLEVYTYDKWNGHYIPEFHEGDVFVPTEINMVEGTTTAPNLLTEPDLIGLMEKNEIGTDATIAEHIQKIIDREYVFKRGRHFRPSTLGIALVMGYDDIGFESSLSQPFLRRQMEADLKQICEGNKTRGDVLQESISQYRVMFSKSETEFAKMMASMAQYYRAEEDRTGGAGAQRGIGHQDDDDDDDTNNASSRDNAHNSGRGRGRGRGRGSRGSRGRGRGGSRGGGSSGSNPPAPPRGGARGGARGGSRRASSSHSNPPPPPRDGPNCGHNIPAVIRVSRKPVSKGRQFYTCGSGGGEHGDSCGFFEWIDDTEPTGNNFERHNNNRNNTNNHAAPSRNNGARNCECGQPAKELTVTKNNDNHGRKFVKCAKPQQEDPCNFFEWLD